MTSMGALAVVALIGFAAQLVDGSLGMGFGVTTATLLAAAGFAPAAASASIHVVKIGTGLMSGTAHWRFGNVHWRAVVMLALPGAVGAFVGAVLLSNIDGDVAAPWVAVLLATLGVIVLVRTVFGRNPTIRLYRPRWRSLGPLGAVGGFVDSVGGGGWGPVTTSTMMAANHMAPNQVIGTVSMAEFIVAIGATVGFIVALGNESIPFGPTVALLLGALIAAPIAAWAVSRLDHRVLGAFIGGMILFYNIPGVLSLLGFGGDAALVARVAVVILTLAIAVFARRRQRRERAAVTALPVEGTVAAASTIPVEGPDASTGLSGSLLGHREARRDPVSVPVTVDDESWTVDRRTT
jgi:uncharacterized membrane protein YfcA